MAVGPGPEGGPKPMAYNRLATLSPQIGLLGPWAFHPKFARLSVQLAPLILVVLQELFGFVACSILRVGFRKSRSQIERLGNGAAYIGGGDVLTHTSLFFLKQFVLTVLA